MRDILEGLRYIHQEGLVHGNLKASNFIYENDSEDSHVKITDISLPLILDKDQLRNYVHESAQFCCNSFKIFFRFILLDYFILIINKLCFVVVVVAAPEVIRNELGNPASDIWSFASFTYLLLCGVDPFPGENINQVYKNIFKANYDTDLESYSNLSTSAKVIISNYFCFFFLVNIFNY